MTPLQKCRQVRGKAAVERERLHPLVGSLGQLRIERLAKFPDYAGQRVREVLILAPAELEARHIDAAAEAFRLGVLRAQRFAFLPRQKLPNAAVAPLPQAGTNLRPCTHSLPQHL